MTATSIYQAIILLGILSIARLLFLLRKKKGKAPSPSLTSSNAAPLFLIQDTCFESPHEAIALFDNSGALVLSNSQFKKQFSCPVDPNRETLLYDFFPEELRLTLQESLSESQLKRQEVQHEFYIEDKHFLFTLIPAQDEEKNCSQVFLFCKELSRPPFPRHCISPDDMLWKAILKLTNPDVLHLDWYSRFNQVVPDICKAFEADELFFLDHSLPVGGQLLSNNNRKKNHYDHQWILSVPEWMQTLSKGKTIMDFAYNFAPQEQIVLDQEGLKVLLLIPLIVDNKLLAVIGLSRKNNATLFEQQQINSLLFIANLLTMAISNQQDRSERDRLGTVVEQSSDCIIIINASGTVLYANPACKKVTGFLPEEITGESIKRLYTPFIRKNLWKNLKNALAKGKPWSGQFANYRKDNTLYEEEMLLSPVYDQEGRVANQVIVKRDITEDKRLESIAEAANLMENIGFIFSSIRHELGNPINSIKVSLSVLESNLKTYDTEDISRFIRRSLSDIGRVEYLLKTLRNFSIFERPDIKATDMRALLNKLIQLTEKDLAKQSVMLTVDHPKEALTGMIDPRAFLQVLLNLTTNAVAALDERENKRITISLLQKQKEQITFIFEDNGSGMDEDTVRNLFRPFFTTKAEGTGLGLVIVKKMLSKMNCSITASSGKGKGTRMEIIIPTV